MYSPVSREPMSGTTLVEWRARMGYSQEDACRELGCARRDLLKWEAAGTRPIPKYIGLACAALALGMTADSGSKP